jgi:hypothetical protein
VKPLRTAGDGGVVPSSLSVPPDPMNRTVLTLPATSSVPPLIVVVPVAEPPASTLAKPPLSMIDASSLAPDDTSCVPPLLTTVP